MILKVNRYSAFLPNQAYRECAAKGRLKPMHKARWVVIQLKETSLNVQKKDPLLPLCMGLKIDRDELIDELIGYLEGRKLPKAIRALDALIVHPVAFGKAMMRIATKFNR